MSQALKATLSRDGTAGRTHKADSEAYNQLLQGNYVADLNTRADLEKAIGFYEALIHRLCEA